MGGVVFEVVFRNIIHVEKKIGLFSFAHQGGNPRKSRFRRFFVMILPSFVGCLRLIGAAICFL